MNFHGAERTAQILGDLGIRHALGQEVENLFFTFAQGGEIDLAVGQVVSLLCKVKSLLT